MADINLLNPENSTSTALRVSTERIFERLMMALVILLIAAYGVFIGLNYLNQKQIDKEEATVKSFQSEISSNSKRQELITRQGQVEEVNKLLAKHMYWSKLLPELSRVTLKSANYSGMQVAGDGSLDLTVTTPSYSDAEKFLQVFDLPEYNKMFSNVKIMSLSRTQKDQQLQTIMRIKLTINPELFSSKPLYNNN